MATGARGEATIVLEDGDEVQILFTNRALASAERALDRSILGVLQGVRDGTTRISEVALIMRSGMEAARRDSKAGGRPITINDAWDLMDAVGFSESTAKVMAAVAAVIAYEVGSEDDPPNG